MSGAVDALVGRLRGVGGLKAVVLKARDARASIIDRWLGVNTVNPRGERLGLSNTFADPVAYEPVDYGLLRRYMRPVRLSREDVVYDVGCGMGRMLALFGRRDVAKVVGIEYDGRLVEHAKRNAAVVRGRRAPIEVRHGDAIEADYDEATIIWMFNPFGPQTMAKVLDRLGDSLRRRPRLMQIAYINPKHEDLFRQRTWLQHVGIERSPFFRTYHASYWESRPSPISDSPAT